MCIISTLNCFPWRSSPDLYRTGTDLSESVQTTSDLHWSRNQHLPRLRTYQLLFTSPLRFFLWSHSTAEN